jgi:hypothetical protein
MQKVKLFTIQEQEVLAYDRVSYFKQVPVPNLVHCEDKVLECMETIDVPVIKIREAVQKFDQTEYIDYYLAISPELRRLLKIATETDIKKHYQWHIQDLKYVLANALTKIELLEDRVCYYNKLPWYKRLFQQV